MKGTIQKSLSPSKRAISYDVIRIIALLMIVMVHVSAYMVIFFPDTAKLEWTVGNLFNGLARAGVPMFLLLSGALLLREDKPFNTKKFYRKSLLTMALLTVGWLLTYGVFYAVILPACEGKPILFSSFIDFILRFKGSEYPHLWYMLMVVGMYLGIPILRLFVKRENKKYIVGIIIAAVIVQFAATTLNLLTLNSDISVTGFLGKLHLEPLTGFLGLLLIGWYLNEYTLKKRTRILLYIAGIASLIGSTVAVHFAINSVPSIRDFVYSELSLPALIYGVALFVFIQTLLKNKTAKRSLPATLADSTFGIYLFHVIPLEVFVRFILPYEKVTHIGPLAYILILFAFTLLVSFAVVVAIGAIKGVRRIFYNK